MRKHRKGRSSSATGKPACCCQVESVISVDERGQMVLPKEIREKANIKAGDKLTVVSWGGGDKVTCICLIKAEDFAGLVSNMLGPMFEQR